MTDLTPAVIAEGERLRDAIRGSTDPQYDQWAFESWIVANGASLLTAARDAARYREALELIWPFFEGEHYYDHPDSVKVRAALAGEREG